MYVYAVTLDPISLSAFNMNILIIAPTGENQTTDMLCRGPFTNNIVLL